MVMMEASPTNVSMKFLDMEMQMSSKLNILFTGANFIWK